MKVKRLFMLFTLGITLAFTLSSMLIDYTVRTKLELDKMIQFWDTPTHNYIMVDRQQKRVEACIDTTLVSFRLKNYDLEQFVLFRRSNTYYLLTCSQTYESDYRLDLYSLTNGTHITHYFINEYFRMNNFDITDPDDTLVIHSEFTQRIISFNFIDCIWLEEQDKPEGFCCSQWLNNHKRELGMIVILGGTSFGTYKLYKKNLCTLL